MAKKKITDTPITPRSFTAHLYNLFFLLPTATLIHPSTSQATTDLLSATIPSIQFSSVQSLSCVPLFVTPWTAAHQASLSVTNSWSLLKLMSIESVMPSNHLILCHPLLPLLSIFPCIRVFSSESVPDGRD